MYINLIIIDSSLISILCSLCISLSSWNRPSSRTNASRYLNLYIRIYNRFINSSGSSFSLPCSMWINSIIMIILCFPWLISLLIKVLCCLIKSLLLPWMSIDILRRLDIDNLSIAIVNRVLTTQINSVHIASRTASCTTS